MFILIVTNSKRAIHLLESDVLVEHGVEYLLVVSVVCMTDYVIMGIIMTHNVISIDIDIDIVATHIPFY